ncbi:MAG: pilus assembly protein PilP [Nitrospirae bacterium]|nr:pilus assembly protein PilP [Nitrospirota bacterium]
MKKRLPLILSASGIVIIIAAAAVVYKLHSGTGTIREGGTPQSRQVVSQRGPSAAAPKVQAQAGPGTTSAGALPDVFEKAVPSIAYEYNAKGRRDPFATLIQKPETERNKGSVPLESYDVSEFKVTGILWSRSEFYAVALAPDGKSYILSEGKKIGLHGGKVYKIVKDSVTVREFLKDYRGIIKPKDTVLKLRREEEG